MKQLSLFVKYQPRLPKTQYEAVVYFLARLDPEMVSTILDKEKIYQDFPKHVFISKLYDAFEAFEKAGDKILTLHRGRCAGCSKGCRGYTFLGKKGDYIDLLFLTEKGIVNDIFECSNFVNDQKITGKLKLLQIDVEGGAEVPF